MLKIDWRVGAERPGRDDDDLDGSDNSRSEEMG